MNRRELLKAAGTGTAAFALAPSLVRAEEPPAKAVLHTLPKLPYAFDALEPHIDAKTMEIHHDRHHQAYVDNLNKALAGTDLAGKPIVDVLTHLDKVPDAKKNAVRNNGGGHYNHSLFWQMLSPKPGKPDADLMAAIAESFKDVETMFKSLKESAMTRFGSGWAWVLVKEGKLKIVSSPNQDNSLMDGSGKPILGIDVWEHAYYLKYQNKRADYVDAVFKVINWDFVGSLFADAKKA
jgi:superoxide dismutase, Fe-Mn family